jgi:hypothetical protein
MTKIHPLRPVFAILGHDVEAVRYFDGGLEVLRHHEYRHPGLANGRQHVKDVLRDQRRYAYREQFVGPHFWTKIGRQN